MRLCGHTWSKSLLKRCPLDRRAEQILADNHFIKKVKKLIYMYDFSQNRLTRWHNADVQGICNLFQGWHGWHKADTSCQSHRGFLHTLQARSVLKALNSLENSKLKGHLLMLMCHFSVQFSREFTSSHALPNGKSPLTVLQVCQPCVTRVTPEKGCKRPVHRRCVSVSTYFSKNQIYNLKN